MRSQQKHILLSLERNRCASRSSFVPDHARDCTPATDPSPFGSRSKHVLITLLCHVHVHGPLSLASPTTKEMLLNDADTFKDIQSRISFTFSIHF